MRYTYRRYVYKLYKKHQAAKKWQVVGVYKFKSTAERHAREIEAENKYMRTMIRKVKNPLKSLVE